MTFLHPELAWGFLSLPMILVLYLLRRRYMRRQVPSIYLWQKTLQEMDVTRPLQKLRRSVLLPLQLMLAAFLVLLLMQPVWSGGAGQTYIFVVDASASMQTKTESETRFAQSLRRIRETVSHAGADDSFVLIRAAETPQTVLSRTGDAAACLRALDGMQCGYGQSDLDAALSLADAIAEDGGTVIVYTDRDVPGDVHVSSFAGAENTALSLLRYESGHLFARVTNYGSEKTVTLVFSADGAVVDAREVTVPADGSAGITLAAPLADTYAAEIREADALEADNRISCTSQKPENYRVVITGSGARFLEAAMASRQDLTVIHGSEDSVFETSADLYILDAPLRMVRDAADTGIVIGAWKDAPQGKAYVQGGQHYHGRAGRAQALPAFRRRKPSQMGRGQYPERDGRCGSIRVFSAGEQSGGESRFSASDAHPSVAASAGAKRGQFSGNVREIHDTAAAGKCSAGDLYGSAGAYADAFRKNIASRNTRNLYSAL